MVSAGRRRLLTQGCLAALAASMVVLAAAATASAPVIENGGFETGSLKGWKVSNTTGGKWFVYKGSSVPLPPIPSTKRGGPPTSISMYRPPRGKYAVASTENGPSTTILYQDFTVPKHSKLKLIAYYKSKAPMTTGPELNAEQDMGDNQQYRIDLMKPAADLRSVAPGDILKTVFRTKTGDPQKLKPRKLEVGLSNLAGEKVRLRVAQTDNRNELVAAIDGVKVKH